MANKSKNIDKFKQALFSNVGFIKENESEPDNKPVESNVPTSEIDADIREKFSLLAKFEGVTEKELIDKALNHFLRLKSMQLEEAMKSRK